MKSDENTYKYLIYLTKCAINDIQPDDKPDTVDFNNLFEIAKFHKIANTVFYSIDKLREKPEKELYSKWKYIRDELIAKDIIQHAEFDKICTAMAENKINILPLKGIELKNLYPASNMRFMSDLDILINKENAHQVHDIMKSLGYSCDNFLKGNHDVYFKKPYMNVEIHRELVSPVYSQFYNYFKNGWDKAYEQKPYIYEYSVDDSFIFLVSHAAKHFLKSGTGIRTVMDIYIYMKANKDLMDMDYITGEFKKIGIEEIFQNFLCLSEKWFGSGAKCDEKFEKSVLSSGIYGTIEQQINNSIKENGERFYILKRTFPSYTMMADQFPVLRKLPFLLPFLWIWRLIYSVVMKGGKVRKELNMYIKRNKGGTE
ncbi:nucleotidyltransferase domain-containing protein [Porcipelethomonas sp.]|uniref:nucleotidyltransferase domain-containing protein n=1 Tax=Porcipelethomonas sp. TaxID=2981675 RepID=UPI003EF4AD68